MTPEQEPPDRITRQSALEALEQVKRAWRGDNIAIDRCMEAIRALPAAPPAPELKELRLCVEETILAATTDSDNAGFVTAYHFKTGAIHRLLGKARGGDTPMDLGPWPTCKRCKGTGEEDNAQFRCPCRWSNSAYRAGPAPPAPAPQEHCPDCYGRGFMSKRPCCSCSGTGIKPAPAVEPPQWDHAFVPGVDDLCAASQGPNEPRCGRISIQHSQQLRAKPSTAPLPPEPATEGARTLKGIDAFVDELHANAYTPVGIRTVLLAFAAHVQRQQPSASADVAAPEGRTPEPPPDSEPQAEERTPPFTERETR